MTQENLPQRTIKLHFDEADNAWKATGNDAKIIFDALGLNDYFLVNDEQPAIIKPENLERFVFKMRENYNIETMMFR